MLSKAVEGVGSVMTFILKSIVLTIFLVLAIAWLRRIGIANPGKSTRRRRASSSAC